MGGRSRSFNTASLVNAHIHNERARFHTAHHLTRHHHGGFVSSHYLGSHHHGSYHHVGISGAALQVMLIRDQRNHAGEFIMDTMQRLHAGIQHGHMRADASKGPRRISSRHPGANDNHLGRRHTGNSTQQDALAARIILQQVRADLRHQPPADLA